MQTCNVLHHLQDSSASSFVSLQSSTLKPPGEPMPRHAYAVGLVAGQNTPPILRALAVNPGKQFLLLTATDEDSRPSAGARAEPMWAVANISVTSAGQLHKARGDVVVPYQGPNIQDDFIHRIFFRVYEQPSRIPPQNLGNFGQLQSWMSRNGLVGQAARTGGKMSELLLTAVRKRPMGVASASIPGFMAALPDPAKDSDSVRRCKAQRQRWQEFVFGI